MSIVQWLERNRFEWPPEHRGTDYEVLQGLRGNRIVGDLGASVTIPLSVPAHLRSGPFATARAALTLPSGSAANVFAAGLPGARLLAFAPNGDLLLSRTEGARSSSCPIATVMAPATI